MKKIIQLAGAKIEEPTYTSPVGSPGVNSSSAEKSSQLLVIEKQEVHELRFTLVK